MHTMKGLKKATYVAKFQLPSKNFWFCTNVNKLILQYLKSGVTNI